MGVAPNPSGPGVACANYKGMKLYVEGLDGSHHVDLCNSATVAEWPFGLRRHQTASILSAADAECPLAEGSRVQGHGPDPKQSRKPGALRRTFTVVHKSFSGGPLSNQMEDANTNVRWWELVARQRAVQPDRGRVVTFHSF